MIFRLKSDGLGTGLLSPLQKHLVAKGIVPASVLTDTDSYPIPEDQLRLASHNVMFGYAGVELLFSDPERAKPHERAHCFRSCA